MEEPSDGLHEKQTQQKNGQMALSCVDSNNNNNNNNNYKNNNNNNYYYYYYYY